MKKLVVVLTVILLGCGAYFTVMAYRFSVGIDFYQHWGIGRAMKASNGALSSPYFDQETYGKFLDQYSKESNERMLKTANLVCHTSYANGLDTIATPLLFTVYALFPQNYLHAYHLFIVLRFVFFIVAIGVLYKYQKINIRTLLVGILIVTMYEPLYCDIRLGNINAVQFILICLGAFFIECYPCKTESNKLFSSVVFLCCLVFFVLLKPNLLLVALALATSLILRNKRFQFAKSAFIVSSFMAMLLIIPCLYFKSLDVWGDWFEYIALGNGKLGYDLFMGNFSTALIVSKLFGIGINSSTIIILLLLIATIAGAIVISTVEKPIVKILANANLSVTLAILTTLALSPLVWWHYYVMSLFSVLWMINIKSKYHIYKILGLSSLLLSSGVISLIDKKLYLYNIYVTASCWIPLWVGSLIMIVSMKDSYEGNKLSVD